MTGCVYLDEIPELELQGAVEDGAARGANVQFAVHAAGRLWHQGPDVSSFLGNLKQNDSILKHTSLIHCLISCFHKKYCALVAYFQLFYYALGA